MLSGNGALAVRLLVGYLLIGVGGCGGVSRRGWVGGGGAVIRVRPKLKRTGLGFWALTRANALFTDSSRD